MPIKINYAGRVAPPTQTGRMPADAFITPDSGLGETAQRAGAQLLNDERQEGKERDRYVLQKTDQLEREARHKAQVDEERGRRNKAAATFATYQVELGAVADDITTRLGEGLLKRDDADKELQKRIAELKKTHVEPLDPMSQADLADNLIRFDGAASAQLTKALREHAKKERASSFTQLTESLQRMGVKDPAGAEAQARAAFSGEGAALFGADAATKQFQTFRENVYAAHFTERLNGVRRDSKGLAALEKDVAGNATLDPDKKNILLGRITGFRETLAAAAARAQDSRLKTLEHQINAADSLILQGFEPSAQQLSTLATAAKGTPYEPVVQAQIAFANQTTKFRALPPRGQEAFINDFEKQVRSNPTPDAVNTLGKMRTIFNSQREAVRNDPISFAAQKGLADVQPLDFSKPDTLPDQLMARASVSRGMQAQYGSPLKVLTTEEAATLGKLMREGSVDQKRQVLGVLANGLKDREAYNATMSQIAPDDPVTAHAGVIAGRGLMTNRNRHLSDIILRGQSILQPNKKEDGQPSGGKLLPMPKEEDLQRAFNNTAGDAFAGKDQARSTFYQSAKAIYAALSSDESDFKGEINSARWQNAVKLATGGIERVNGRSVLLPQGYELSRFRDELNTRSEAIAASGQIEIDARRLRNLPLENVGDGRYVFRAGDGVLVDKKGKRVVVDFNQPVSR